MGWIPAPEVESEESPRGRGQQAGIALFMVIGAISMISLLVTEFTYTAQVNKKLAYDSLDQLKAHYLAKSGLKLSLLRLKAYQQVKAVAANLAGGGGGGGKAAGGAAAVPKGILEKIWSFPFMYPIPTSIPGLTMSEKDAIEKFQKESSLDGGFTAIIESESSKYNLNLLIAGFAPTDKPNAKPSSTPNPSPSGNPVPGPSPSTTPFDPQAARTSLAEFLFQLFTQKSETDPDFAGEYRDFRVDDLVDGIAGWADFTYERRLQGAKDTIPMKKAPFYSITELHLVPGMDDQLYDLFAPNLTANPTPGINVNTMAESMLKALVPAITDEEIKAFYKYRDSTEEDNLFKETDSFYKYLQTNVQSFRNSETEVTKFKEGLAKKQIRLVVDESEFRITVEATKGNSKRTLQAWVTLNALKSSGSGAKPPGGLTGGAGTNARPPGSTDISGAAPPPDPGLRITFMRIL